MAGAPGRSQTCCLVLRRAALCPVSYRRPSPSDEKPAGTRCGDRYGSRALADVNPVAARLHILSSSIVGEVPRAYEVAAVSGGKCTDRSSGTVADRCRWSWDWSNEGSM